MKKRSILETVVLSAALIFIPLVTRAALEESKVIEGVVKAVSDSKITLTVQSIGKSQTNDIDLQTLADTKFEGVNKTEIKEGDKLKIEYHQDLDSFTADSVKNAE